MTDITKMTDERLGNILFDALNDAINDHGILSWRYFARYVRSLIPPAAQPVARVPVAMTQDGLGRTVVCNDGTVLYLPYAQADWRELPPIPQPDATPIRFALPPASVRLTPEQQAAQDEDRQQAEEAMHDAQMAAERELHDIDSVREAAPELLAAVIDCGNYFHGMVEREADAGKGAYQPGRDEHIRLVEMCDAAIAKAEGRR